MKKFFTGFVLVLVLGLMMFPEGHVYATDARQIASGVYIGPIDVSGLSITDAEAKVSDYVDQLSNE